MSSPLGLPQTPEQRPPLRRGVKESLAALAALPVLLAAGIYIGGHLHDDGPASLQPAAGEVRTPAPLVTVRPATPLPVVTVKPAPVVTVKPAAPAPIVTVRPAAPAPIVTVKPAAPAPVATVKPAAPAPVVTVVPHGPTTSVPPTMIPFPPGGQPPGGQPAGGQAALPPFVGPVAPTTPPAAPAMVLGRGSAGADVRAWQLQMARRRWRIAVDGAFGPETERVAREFQRIKGLRIDGLVGRETWDAAWRRPVIL